MAKVKRYDGDEGSFVEAGSGPSSEPDDLGPPSERSGSIQPAKSKVVTKEQMQAAGYDNLRDYLNATNPGGPLKRRDGSAPSKPAPKAEPKVEPKSEPVSVTKEKTTVSSSPSAKDETKTETTKKTYRGLDGKMHTVEAQKEEPGSGFLGKRFREALGSKYAKGGSIKSTASSRADGIATRGKTRGKIC